MCIRDRRGSVPRDSKGRACVPRASQVHLCACIPCPRACARAEAGAPVRVPACRGRACVRVEHFARTHAQHTQAGIPADAHETSRFRHGAGHYCVNLLNTLKCGLSAPSPKPSIDTHAEKRNVCPRTPQHAHKQGFLALNLINAFKCGLSFGHISNIWGPQSLFSLSLSLSLSLSRSLSPVSYTHLTLPTN